MNGMLVPTNGPAALALAHELGARPDATGLTIEDPNLPFEDWQNIGRAIAFVGNAWQWWVGDWFNYGEALYGDKASAAVDDLQTRYDAVRSVTGSVTGTLQNIRSICKRVPKANRKKELGFWIHSEVAKLEPDAQQAWTEKAVANSWTRNQLRIALRGGDPGAATDSGGSGGTSVAELIRNAARDVLTTAQDNGDGSFSVPGEVVERLRSAFGQETK